MYRLGVLTPGVRPAPSVLVTSNVLPAILREMGYVEGQNLVIEQRFADGKLDRLPGLARDLVELRVDALVAASPPAVQATRAITKTIPILMLLAYSDPVELGPGHKLRAAGQKRHRSGHGRGADDGGQAAGAD